MSFSQNVSFLKNIEFGLWNNNSSLEEVCNSCNTKLSSLKTRLYMIKQTKRLSTPLDRRLHDHLIKMCDGYEEWAKELF